MGGSRGMGSGLLQELMQAASRKRKRYDEYSKNDRSLTPLPVSAPALVSREALSLQESACLSTRPGSSPLLGGPHTGPPGSPGGSERPGARLRLGVGGEEKAPRSTGRSGRGQ